MHVGFVIAVFVGFAILAAVAFWARGRMPSLDDPGKLAALLVHELELYNADLLERARLDSAIYRYLGEEIGRAREMFEDRVPEELRGRHFDDALVRILAEGDASKLGPGQPSVPSTDDG